MYIQPETNIRLLQGVPLDPDYRNTLYWDSVNAQTSYFRGKTRYNLTDQTYQRVNKGVARVGIKADSLYNINYMMFQNSAFGNKWFYAFVTSIDYVNNQTSDVHFEIDVLQTWFFDYSPMECYIERMHTPTDEIGDHIEPEPVSPGEYVFHEYSTIDDYAGHPVGSPDDDLRLDNLCVVVAIVDVEGGQGASQGHMYNNVYGSAKLTAFRYDDTDGINTMLSEYISRPDSVLNIYMCPAVFAVFGGYIPKGGVDIEESSSTGAGITRNYLSIASIKKGADLDTYVPKNAKMYTYPYNFFHLDNGSGNELNLRYEFFPQREVSVEVTGNCTTPVATLLRPRGYKGAKELNSENLLLQSYPMCSWNVDTYKAWAAQNSVPLAIDTGMSALSAVGSLLTGNIGGAISTGVGAAANVAKQEYFASIAADISKGSFNNGSVQIAARTQNFFGGRCCVNKVSAKMIDDFFTMYGYQVGVVGVPPRKNRPHFTYVKTIDANIDGALPADDCRKIADIYNNGVTFWAHPSEVGQWQVLDNAPG